MKKIFKNKKISTIIIFLALLISAYLIYPFFHNAKIASAWYNDSYHYRQSATVTNNSGRILTDYQLKISLDTATLITQSRLQSDCDDLRFADISGQELPYWIESGCNSATTKIWVKASKVPMGSSTIYVYYGNSTATNGQNGDATFELFDDFLSPNINYSKWDAIVKGTGGTFGVTSAGEATLNPSSATHSSANLQSKKTFTNAIAIEIRRKQNTDTSYMHFSLGSGIIQDSTGAQSLWADTIKSNGYWWRGQAASLGSISSAAQGSAPSSLVGLSSVAASFATYARYQYMYDSAGGLWWFTDDTYKMSATNTTYQSNAKNILITYGELNTGQGDGGSVDWVFVRKVSGTPTTTEPSVGSFGTAEVSEAPVAYWKFDEGYGATVYDESTSANDGTIVNASWKTEDDCKMGKCLSFNGSTSKIDMNREVVTSTTSFSVSAWIKTGNLAAYQIIASEIGNNLNIGEFAFRTTDSGKLQFLRRPTAGSTATKNWVTTASISTNSWTYVAVVFNSGTSADLYINGIKESPTPTDGDASLGASTEFHIGDMTSLQFFNGSIDEVKIYPYARTAAQVKKDYAAGRVKNSGTGSGTGVSAGEEVQSYKTEGLVGHWRMDEASWNGTASEVIDASGLGNHGTAVGAGGITGTSSTAKYGRSGDFDGTDDYVEINDSNNLDVQSFSISAWIKGSYTGQEVIISKWVTSGQFSYIFDLNSGLLRMILSTDGTNNSVIKQATSALSNNTWYFINAIYDSPTKTLEFYVNGSIVSSSVTSGSIPSSIKSGTSAVRISRTVNDASGFQGAIDDVRIYNRALSGAEIRRLYNDAPPPVLHLKMDEGSGQYAFDNSGRSATGTLGSSASASTDDPTWASASSCKFGGCMSFDGGTDYIDIADVASLRFTETTPFTISTWFKTGVGQLKEIIEKKSSNDLYRIVMQTDGSLYFEINDGTNNLVVNPTTAVNDNKWHYAVISYDGANLLTAYFDGINIGTDSSPTLSGLTTAGGNFFIGTGANGTFSGFIDDVRVYNYARTPSQIREDMLAGAPVYTSPRYSVAPNSVNNAENSSGMVAYWKFDEGTTSTYAYDATANGNDGTYFGSVSSTPGKFGRAADFANAGYINAGDVDEIDGTNRITVSAWIKWGGTAGGVTAEKEIAIKENVFAFAAGFTASKAKFWIKETNWQNSGDSKTNIDDGNWHYYTGVYDGTYIKIYIDGILENSNNIGSVTLSSNTSPVCIGARTCDSSPNYYWTGKIDELKIYNVALTADEIKADYNKGKAMMLGAPSSEDIVAASGSGDRPAQSSAGGKLVGWWKMDEKSGQYARDYSGYANHGTLGATASASTDDPTWKSSASCHSGSCLSFDGTADYVLIPNHPSLQVSNKFTLSAWIKPSKTIDNYYRILCKENDGVGYCLGVYATNKFEFYGGYTGGAGLVDINSVETLQTNVWQHVVVTFDDSDSNDIKLYLNGKLDSQEAENGVPQGSVGLNVVIGARSNGTLPFPGSIDDVKIWNYALNAAEIAYEYNRGKPIAHWKFDEGQGDWAYDASGNGNHGYAIIGTGGTQSTTSSAWTAGASGKFNGAMSFDGTDDYVNTSDIDAIDGASALTVAAWVKEDTIALNHTIIAKWDYQTQGNFLFGVAASQAGTLTAIIATSLVDGGSGSQSQTTNVVLQAGVWKHAVMVFDGSQTGNANRLKIYVDGVNQAMTQTAGTVPATLTSGGTATVKIGSWGGTLTRRWDGSIDDVRIYNYALSASQIKEIYNNGKAVYFK